MSGQRSKDEVQQGFVEGLCQMLSAMNAATTRNVISSTMAHLLVCNGGARPSILLSMVTKANNYFTVTISRLLGDCRCTTSLAPTASDVTFCSRHFSRI